MPTFSHWLIYAFGSAFFAAMTALLGKLGVHEINSNLATFIRTAVILIMVFGIVIARGQWEPLNKLSPFGLSMLVLSAIATGLSWLCYYRALQLGPASKVASVDKLSVVMVMIGAALFLRESITWKTAIGGLLITAGAIFMAL